MTYPYLHVTPDSVSLKERLRDAIDFNSALPASIDGRMEQGG